MIHTQLFQQVDISSSDLLLSQKPTGDSASEAQSTPLQRAPSEAFRARDDGKKEEFCAGSICIYS